MYLVSFSALEYWQSIRPTAGPSFWRSRPRGGFVAQRYRFARVASTAGRPPTDAGVRRLLDGELAGLSTPLHLGVRAASLRRPSRLKTCHVVSEPIPAGAFVRVTDNVLVAAPEFALVQIAPLCTAQELIWLMYGLCGTYASRSGEGSGTLYGLAPVTDVARIGRFAAAVSGITGAKKVFRATRHALDNSASPAETALAMLLTLPYAMGGYGMPRPEMNRWITPDRAHRDNVGQMGYCCDVLWPDKGLALEYDGEEMHTGLERIAHDATRRNDLEYLGISVLPVTKRQLYRTEHFDRLMHQVARRLGVRLRMFERPYNWRYRNVDLRAFLLEDGNRFDSPRPVEGVIAARSGERTVETEMSRGVCGEDFLDFAY